MYSTKKSTREINKLLEAADVRIDGDRPWDIQIHDDRLYHRVLAHGSLGLGEAYMDGWWDCRRLDQFFYRVLSVELDEEIQPWTAVLRALVARLVNFQRASRAYLIGRRHYDIGNDLYRAMLDQRMIYSCGYWRDATTLEDAQRAKLDLVCQKLGLEPGMRVLDIGCGWGGAAQYAAERYGVNVVGITVSREQVKQARELCRDFPVSIRLQDYRDLNEKFDRIFSIGMFEHVGFKNHERFMQVVKRCLKPDGRFLLHTIGDNQAVVRGDPWIEKYIFPNSLLPSPSQISKAIEGRFVMEDWENFGAYYDKTLMCWYRNFQRAWPRLKSQYDNRFYRMWTYYLLSCAGTFRARKTQLWQVLLSDKGMPGGFDRRSVAVAEKESLAVPTWTQRHSVQPH